MPVPVEKRREGQASAEPVADPVSHRAARLFESALRQAADDWSAR